MTRRCLSRRRLVAATLLAALLALGAFASPVGAQSPTLAPPVTVDGPSPDISALSGLSVARDGTGGIVYVKNVAGVAHVFVSRLLGGIFGVPQQIDAQFSGPSSQPVIAAGGDGVLLIAFINGGSLYAVEASAPWAPYTAPIALFAGASNPALAMSNFGKGYLAFAALGTGGHDVRVAYYYQGQWAVETSPLDAIPADDAGTGTGRPAVAAAGDGVGIVAWGEAGHVYSRRVWGTSPSFVYEQADVPSLSGWNEVFADQPSVAAGGDSSYADVVFHEVLSNGSQIQQRVLANRLHGSVYDGVIQADGLATPGFEGSIQPQVAESEYGHGVIVSARDASNQLWATTLGDNGATQGLLRVDSLQNATPPDAIAGGDGLYSGFIVWQHDPGTGGMPEIRARYYAGSNLGPEQVISSPTLGPTNAAGGLATGGDINGDAAIAWVQGTGPSTQIVTAQLYEPPSSFGPVRSFRYSRSRNPVLAWSPARELWGQLRYTVSLDGAQIAQTISTAISIPTSLYPFGLSQGRHVWGVTAVNPAGLQSTARTGTVWVDTVAPRARLTLTGSRLAGSPLHIYVRYTDSPQPAPRAGASGVASVTVKWGDGTKNHIRHGKFHVYARPGRYRLTVIVKDRAGNATRLVRHLSIG